LCTLVANVVTAASLDEAGGLSPEPEMLVLAVQPGNVTEQIRRARALFQRSAIAVVGYLPAISAFEAGRAGADALLIKPTTGSALLRALGARELSPSGEFARPSLARAEWEYLNATLSECQGNRSEAARQLGIRRFVLQRKLSKGPPSR